MIGVARPDGDVRVQLASEDVAAPTSDRRFVLAFSAIAAVAWVTLLLLARDLTFRGDDWDFVAGRSLTDVLGLLRPFNEQWVTGGAFVFRLLFEVVGMHSYLPYLATLLTAHVVAAGAVALLVKRTSGSAAGLAAGAVVAFLGVGGENLNQAFQISMVLSAAAGLWAVAVVWLWDRPGVASLLLTLAVASHAIGVVFVAACVVLCVSLPGDRLKRVSWMALPIVALAAWTFLFDLPYIAGRGGAFMASIAAVPSFVAAGSLAAVGATVAAPPAAGVIVLAVLASIAAVWVRRPAHPELALGAVVALATEYALVAVSRGQFGLGAVIWSRYLYIGVPLVLVAVAAWFGSPARLPDRWRPAAGVILAGLALAAVAANLRAYVGQMDGSLSIADAERSTVAIIAWRPTARRPAFDVHLPPPSEVRSLVARYGSPARDILVPGVVPAVPAPIAGRVCAAMVPVTELDACLATIADAVGGP